MPAATTILDEIQSRLGNITTANGYYFDIKKIERGKLEPFRDYDLPAVNYWPTFLESEKTRHKYESRTLSIFFEIYEATRDSNFSDISDKLVSDLVASLDRDSSDPNKGTGAKSKNLGGLVRSFNFVSQNYQIGKGQKPFCGALVEFQAVYAARNNDMENIHLIN